MPANNVKQYVVRSDPATKPDAPASSANSDRVSLFIQNTGINVGLIRFKDAVQLDGGDIELASKAAIQFNEESALIGESLNFYSVAGTTWAIVEGVRKNG